MAKLTKEERARAERNARALVEAAMAAGVSLDPEDYAETAPDDADTPELTDEMLAAMVPIDALPDEHKAMIAATFPNTKLRGPGKKRKYVQISLRVDAATLAAYRESGKGYQKRMRDDLAAAAGLKPSATTRRTGKKSA